MPPASIKRLYEIVEERERHAALVRQQLEQDRRERQARMNRVVRSLTTSGMIRR